MTEADWLACTDPAPMLAFVRGRTSARRLRLIAVACCRRLEYLSREAEAALDVAERFADGTASDGDRSDARKAAQRAAQGRGVTRTPTAPKGERRGASAVYYAAARDAAEAARTARQLVVESLIWRAGGYAACDARAVRDAEHGPQAVLVRDIIGNPFRPVKFDPSWRTEAVVGLVHELYESRDFAPMSVLADALEDAGCTDPDVLAHCRAGGPHVRGCWVIDRLLGRA